MKKRQNTAASEKIANSSVLNGPRGIRFNDEGQKERLIVTNKLGDLATSTTRQGKKKGRTTAPSTSSAKGPNRPGDWLK